MFLTLPDAVAAEVGPDLVARGVRVFDLSGTFRLRDAAQRRHWYPATPEIEEPIVYGLTEHCRAALPDARLVACPGCYPTAALLALRPLSDAGILEPDGDVIVDAKSGISGAGKKATERTHFSECHGSVAAYGVLGHRHGAEIEQELGRPVTFTPHLVPLDRGILETIYVRTRPDVSAAQVADTLEQAYADAPFVRLTGDALPEIKHVTHTNLCDVGWKLDAASRRLVLIACLDNLVKGAAGQAVQNLNVAFGLGDDDRSVMTPTARVVLKLGGELLTEPDQRRDIAAAIGRLAAGAALVVVHGGGREVDAELAERRIAKRAVDGLRITDAATLGVVVGMLAGQVNTRLVAAARGAGVRRGRTDGR